MHADDVEERLAVDVPAGAGGAGHDVGAEIGFGKVLLGRLGGGHQGLAEFGDFRGLQVSLSAHDGGDASGVVTSGVRVIGKASSHEQSAKVRIAESERTVVVRVAGDDFGGITGVVYENFLRGDDDVDGMAIGLDVKGAVGGELQQI